ncbi:FAD/NAD-P-binding domain-containing protein [Dendrothele bispora CBS 962.96]|uniref:FAD/NAD-P-binding domain-containing protein n=1 Tax=Dendrothele bispora (strain CBS 962.96) TaxID=1314807 RepID=A0A4V4HGK6_DENBC|nr:FAD/NAD-P-binding domain-containing protein [Dendrothele bispora CBS 962.96]
MSLKYDCVVIGSGNAGSSAALSAIEHGCKRVLVVEKAPVEWAGGNGYFTAGAYRTTHTGLADLLPIVTNVSSEQADKIDMDPYTREDFVGDVMRLSGGRSDPKLVDAVVDNSRDAVRWLADKVKVPFIFSFHRQAYQVGGRQKFWGGLVLSCENGGIGLMESHHKALKEAGVEIWFESPATELLSKDGVITGVVVNRKGHERVEIESPAVILAAGGFEANTEMRKKHLGQEWANAKVRGTPYNTGDGFTLASTLRPKLTPDWSGCHSTAWDFNTSSTAGSRLHTNTYTKSGYPLGLMLNSAGLRFVDEGEDYRNYTYAKFGREILRQPAGYAFQVYDSKVLGMLRKEEYGDGVVRKIFADSIEELAEKLHQEEGLEDTKAFVESISKFNEAVVAHRTENPSLKWDPAVKDGMSTESSRLSLSPPKSNWALPLDEKPFMAVKITCGITFTFGGLAIDPETGNVISEETGKIIEGLFCTGEMVGGLFYGNYPGGSGLTAGTVFGRKAGKAAAKLMKM